MRSVIQFLLYNSRGFKRRFGIILLIGLAEVAFSLLFVWFSKTIIDIATGERTGDLLPYSFLLVLLVILQILFRACDIRMRRMTEVRLANSVRYRTFSRLLYTRWQDLATLHSGDVLTRMIKDTDDLVNLLVTSFPLVFVAVAQFSGALVILYLLDPWLALTLGVGMPLLALLGKFYYRHMRKYTKEVKEHESTITSMLEESLQNQVVIRTFERQEDELSRLEHIQTKLHQSIENRTKVSIFANVVMGISFNGGYITAFLWSVYGLARRSVGFGTVTAFLQLVNRIQRPLFDLIRLLPSFISARTAIDRLIYLTGFSLEDARDGILLEGDVTLRIDRVTFTYSPTSEPVLSDFSMMVKPGTMVAVSGETGVGKTTLLRLLLGLVAPASGSMILSSPLQSVAISERTRSNFVYVPQGGSLFSGTIRENLLLGDPQASEAALTRVLQIASAGFVFTLPDGLDTRLSEGGAGLSEGQAQRIAIARALLRPGRILLFDEATSALDPETARNFLHNLKKELGSRSVIFITHQPEVASFCDLQYRLPAVSDSSPFSV
jgi:ABC-type multidrug transport system fused ATPase/permease subunit